MKESKICMNCKNAEKDLLAYLRSHLGYDTDFYDFISSKLRVCQLNKVEVIVKEGQVCNYAFWLQSGYGRYFKTTTDAEGLTKVETIDFCKPGKILFIAESFFNELPSNFGFELAAGAVIIPFTKQCFEFLKMRGPEAAILASKVLALDQSNGIKGMRMMKKKPRERYREFLKYYGADIEQYFAIKEIASNLGLQPSYLSRLRGEYLKKKIGLSKYLQTVFVLLQFV